MSLSRHPVLLIYSRTDLFYAFHTNFTTTMTVRIHHRTDSMVDILPFEKLLCFMAPSKQTFLGIPFFWQCNFQKLLCTLIIGIMARHHSQISVYQRQKFISFQKEMIITDTFKGIVCYWDRTFFLFFFYIHYRDKSAA